MNIYEFAMNMEKESEEFYKKLAENSNNKSIKQIFLMMANEESKHYKTFKSMNENKTIESVESTLFKDAKSVFQNISKNNNFTNPGNSQADIYIEAQKLENNAEKFYREKASEVKDDLEKEVILKIAEQEKNHFIFLDIMIDFLKTPETWLENAEWNHLDQY